MTLLGIDYGEKNIGTAIGYFENGVTNTLEVVRRTKDEREIPHLLNLIKQWHIDTVVLGLPLSSNGEETPACKKVRAFGSKLLQQSKKIQLEFSLEFFSEQDSTRLSNQGLSRTQKKKLGDAYAAEHIISQYIMARNE